MSFFNKNDQFDGEFDTKYENVFDANEKDHTRLPAIDMISPIISSSPIFSSKNVLSSISQNSKLLVWDSPQGTSLYDKHFSFTKLAERKLTNQKHNNQIIQTPKSSKRVYNPFELCTLDSLAMDTCSPGMFKQTKHRKNSFQWTIESKAVLCPSTFAEVEQSPSTTIQEFFSPNFEQKAQSVLNNYWRNVHFLPSPNLQFKKTKNDENKDPEIQD